MFRDLLEVAAKLKARGLAFIYDYVRDVALFDWINRTDTRRRKQNALRVGANIHYVASFTSVIRHALTELRQRTGDRFAELQFIDVGSGKGKVVLIYGGRYGCEARHAPLGIEYDGALCTIANNNIARMGLDTIGARIIHDDALNVWDHINKGEAIFFLYNPFIGDVFHEFVRKIADVPHFMIYVDPAEREFLQSRGYAILADHHGRYHADSWLIASFDPRDGGKYDIRQR